MPPPRPRKGRSPRIDGEAENTKRAAQSQSGAQPFRSSITYCIRQRKTLPRRAGLWSCFIQVQIVSPLPRQEDGIWKRDTSMTVLRDHSRETKDYTESSMYDSPSPKRSPEPAHTKHQAPRRSYESREGRYSSHYNYEQSSNHRPPER